MPDAFGFNHPRHVRRALRTAREVLDKKRVPPAGMRMLQQSSGGTSSSGGSSTVCPCGTTYARGSITDCTYGGEHATDYEFAKAIHGAEAAAFVVSHSSGCVWDSDPTEIAACYGGNHEVIATLTVCEGEDICGVTVPQAKLTIVTTGTNDCETETECGVQGASVSLTYICRNWHPLATSTFEPVDPQDPTGAVDNCVICVSPVAPEIGSTLCFTHEIPDEFLAYISCDIVSHPSNVQTCCAGTVAVESPLTLTKTSGCLWEASGTATFNGGGCTGTASIDVLFTTGPSIKITVGIACLSCGSGAILTFSDEVAFAGWEGCMEYTQSLDVGFACDNPPIGTITVALASNTVV